MSGSRKPRRLHSGTWASLLLFLPLLGFFAAVACNSRPTAIDRPLTPQEERGRRLYEAHCAVCHDAYSTNPRQGPGLAGLFHKKYLPSGAPANDERARDSFMAGRRNMPAFQSVLDDQQANNLMAYLHTL